jgi:hypothetical protein
MGEGIFFSRHVIWPIPAVGASASEKHAPPESYCLSLHLPQSEEIRYIDCIRIQESISCPAPEPYGPAVP